jgi:hypothetical protein
MPEIDLKKLITRQKIFVPVARKDLLNAIIRELNKQFVPLQPTDVPTMPFVSIPSWEYEEHGNCIEFSLNKKYFYITLKAEHPILKTILKLEKEYYKLKRNERINYYY